MNIEIKGMYAFPAERDDERKVLVYDFNGVKVELSQEDALLVVTDTTWMLDLMQQLTRCIEAFWDVGEESWLGCLGDTTTQEYVDDVQRSIRRSGLIIRGSCDHKEVRT